MPVPELIGHYDTPPWIAALFCYCAAERLRRPRPHQACLTRRAVPILRSSIHDPQRHSLAAAVSQLRQIRTRLRQVSGRRAYLQWLR